jgi:hypothetical protein
MMSDTLFGLKSEDTDTENYFAVADILYLKEMFLEPQRKQELLVMADRMLDQGYAQGELIQLEARLQTMPEHEQIPSEMYQQAFELKHTLRAQAYRKWNIADLFFEQGAVVGIHAHPSVVAAWIDQGLVEQFVQEYPLVVHWHSSDYVTCYRDRNEGPEQDRSWMLKVFGSALGGRWRSYGLRERWMVPFWHALRDHGESPCLESLFVDVVTQCPEENSDLVNVATASLVPNLSHLQLNLQGVFTKFKDSSGGRQWIASLVASEQLEVLEYQAGSSEISETIVNQLLNGSHSRLRKLVWLESAIESDSLTKLSAWLTELELPDSTVELFSKYRPKPVDAVPWSTNWWESSSSIGQVGIRIYSHDIEAFCTQSRYATTTRLRLELTLKTEQDCLLLQESSALQQVRELVLYSKLPFQTIVSLLASPNLSALESLVLRTPGFKTIGELQAFLACSWMKTIKHLGLYSLPTQEGLVEAFFSSPPPPKLSKMFVCFSQKSEKSALAIHKSLWLSNLTYLSMNGNYCSNTLIPNVLSSSNLTCLQTLELGGGRNVQGESDAKSPSIQITIPNLERIKSEYCSKIDWFSLLANSQNRRLRVFTHRESAINTAEIEQFVKSEASCWLEIVEMYDCGIDDKCCAEMAGARTWQKLRFLLIGDSSLTQKGVKSWIGVSPYFPALHTLYFDHQTDESQDETAGSLSFVDRLKAEWGNRYQSLIKKHQFYRKMG